ncbi:ATP-binding protein [Pontibacter sp. E15-1]|uniref:sensor histidine kinase n=1 Tax=Pontibacter sp. E15-1 TaxID=2919918 RepID=UPI001F4F4477|nr:ATP-binding protein [Pontibacter sp. E15-1]MCJ8164850.1 ATP-binding protein [Pontibacter sp. E15-1]
MDALDAKEKERLKTLEAYEILDTPAEKDYDDLTVLAAHICASPIAYISLLANDRQWLKSKVGTEISETAVMNSFCQHALQQGCRLEVRDTLADSRFRRNPFVTNPPHIRFYASSPLISHSGHIVGTFCVMDTVPKQLSDEQRNALDVLARQAITHLELRLRQKQLESEKERLRKANADLDNFVHVITRDLEEPIMNIHSVVEWLQEDLAANDYSSLTENLGLIQDRAVDMRDLIAGLLQYAVIPVDAQPKTEVSVREMIRGIAKEHSHSPDMMLHIAPRLPVFGTEEGLLRQVFANLISNAFKYHQPGKGNVWVDMSEGADTYTFCVKDDGPGIPPQHHQKVFGLFERLLRDVGKTKGAGIGLAIVRKIVTDRGGRVWIQSEPGQKTTFFFTWPK